MVKVSRHKLEKRILETARKRNLWRSGDKILVACSGGPDSLSLLYLLSSLAKTEGISLGVACVDHCLRPESQAELMDVKAYAEKLGWPFYGFKFDVAKLSEEHKISLEMAGRKVRYQAFAEIKSKYGYDWIAVAHHRDDQGETVLAHLIRGSALTGLGGMAYRRDEIIRPLLDITKADIYAYLNDMGLVAAEDKTNKDLIYMRNKIRWQVMPVLNELNPNFGKNLSQLANSVREDEEFLQGLTRMAYKRCLVPEVDDEFTHKDFLLITVFNRKLFLQEPEVIQRRLWQKAFSPYIVLSYAQIEQLQSMVHGHKGTEFYAQKIKIWLKCGKIYIGRNLMDATKKKLDNNLKEV